MFYSRDVPVTAQEHVPEQPGLVRAGCGQYWQQALVKGLPGHPIVVTGALYLAIAGFLGRALPMFLQIGPQKSVPMLLQRLDAYAHKRHDSCDKMPAGL